MNFCLRRVNLFLSIIFRFYYKKVTPNPRDPDQKLAPNVINKLDEKYSRQSLEDCVNGKEKECVFVNGLPYDLTIPYFCGQDSRCM